MDFFLIKPRRNLESLKKNLQKIFVNPVLVKY